MGTGMLRTAAFLVTLVMISCCLMRGQALSAERATLRIGDNLPRVTLQALDGSRVRLPDDFRGKVVIIHFWAGGCSSCKEEMPAMEKLYVSHGRKGLVILAVNVGQRKEKVKELVREIGISYPVLLDTAREMAQKYDVVGVPRTYLVDRNGLIRYRIIGAANAEVLKKQVLSLL